ncbi:MAG: DHHW family protein [Oscillospiraceae bacterium]|nr:DHHW family protein [Oscillospiraceae bacterium]
MNKKALWAEALIFLAFIGAFFILNLVLPDRQFSEQENRYLQMRPEFSFKSLFSGDYTSKFETYTTDQFTFRDEWITLKAASELALGKQENNDVHLCENGTLIEGFKRPESSVLDSNMSALNTLVGNTDAKVYFALIPDKSDLYSSLLPKNVPNDSEKEVIDYCYGQSNATNVDIYSALSAHTDEYIFYRTDHHWTSLGAYYGLSALAESMGLPCPALDSYTDRHVVSEEFYGTTWSSSGFSWVDPDTMEIFVNAPEGLKVTSYPQGSPVEGKLYDFSFLEKKDKYSMFMGGNCPMHVIETGNEDKPSLLILRDSYMDSLIPFLLDDFSEIHVLDLRYYRASLKAYIEQNNFDNVLVCYSVSNFCSDSNIFLLGM